jgi:hypothetical protein
MDQSDRANGASPSLAAAVEVSAKFADPNVPIYAPIVVRRGVLGMEDGTDFGFFELAGLHNADNALVIMDKVQDGFDLIQHVLKVMESMETPDESKRVDLEGLG